MCIRRKSNDLGGCIVKQNDYYYMFLLVGYKSESKNQRKAISNLGPNIGGLQKTRIIGWC